MSTISVKCGVCGNDMAIHPSVSSTGLIEIVATCPSCKAMDQQIGDLEDRVYELQKVTSAWNGSGHN